MNQACRNKRWKIEVPLPVTDVMTGQHIGRLGNLSVDGVLLICTQRPHNNAIYQVSFQLPDTPGSLPPIEIGINEQWTAPANVPGQLWSGFRIIDIALHDLEVISHWLERDHNN